MRNLSANRLGGRKARATNGRDSDPYSDARKPPGVSACTTCHAIQQRGRWKWEAAPADAVAVLCPACRRIADRCPAHVLRLEGVPRDQRPELLSLVHRVAEEEMREHPLERLVSLGDTAKRIEISTTGTQLPRRLRAAIGRAFRRRFSTEADADHSAMTWKSPDGD